MSARIALVVAMAENRVIGADGTMPWRLPGDLKRFRAMTMGKPIVMGRKTFESIGKPLDGRDNIVVSRNPELRIEGARVAPGIGEALELARASAARTGADEICVIGGAEIYRAALAHADLIYLTEVHASPDGDVLFPDLDPDQWAEISRTACAAEEGDSADTSLIVLERKQAGSRRG